MSSDLRVMIFWKYCDLFGPLQDGNSTSRSIVNQGLYMEQNSSIITVDNVQCSENSIIGFINRTSINKICSILDNIDSWSVDDPNDDFDEAVEVLMMFFFHQPINANNGIKFYRARRHESKDFFTQLSELNCPPANLVKTRGRLNEVNQTIYYAAEDPTLALLEVTFPAYQEKGVTCGFCTIVRSRLLDNSNLNFANLYPEEPIQKENQLKVTTFLSALRKDYDDELHTMFNKTNLEKINKIRNYISTRVCQSRNNQRNFDCYKITSSIASNLFKIYKIDGIIYPSAIANNIGSCIAINPEIFKERFGIDNIVRIYYEYNNPPNFFSYRITHVFTGIDSEKRILWKESWDDRTYFLSLKLTADVTRD